MSSLQPPRLVVRRRSITAAAKFDRQRDGRSFVFCGRFVVVDQLQRLPKKLQRPHAIAGRGVHHLAAAAMLAAAKLAGDHEPVVLDVR